MKKRALLTAVAACAVLLVACGGGDGGGQTVSPQTMAPTPSTQADILGDGVSPAAAATVTAAPTPVPTPVGQPDCTNNAASAAAGDLTWGAIFPESVAAPIGYTVLVIDPANPFLEVRRHDEPVGYVELRQFGWDAAFDPAQGYEALKGWTQQYYDSMRAEREAAGLSFESDAAKSSKFGAFCGIAFGFTAKDAEGAVIERTVGVASYDAGKMYVVSSHFSVADPLSGFVDLEGMQDFEPYVKSLAKSVRVPAP